MTKPRTSPLLRAALATSVLALSAGAAMAHSSHPTTPDAAGGTCSVKHRAEIEAVIQDYIEVSNDQDLARYPEVFADDFLLVSTAGTFDGLPAYIGVMSAVYTALPDIHYTVDELLIDGDNAVLRYTYTGTNLGSFLGLPPTGNTVTCTGLEIDRIEDGKIIEVRNFTDYHCLLAGIGAL